MPGKGKYTQYAPPSSSKNNRLARMFSNAPYASLVGKENETRLAVIANAKIYLTPSHTAGDPGHFPMGVDLDYSGNSASVQPPNTAEGADVKWTRPGDPATSYFPDVSSPGPGRTEGHQKDVDPGLTVADYKPGYVSGGPNTGTRSPSDVLPKVKSANTLGEDSKLGDSGGNT